jgi:hypothetical protein
MICTAVDVRRGLKQDREVQEMGRLTGYLPETSILGVTDGYLISVPEDRYMIKTLWSP